MRRYSAGGGLLCVALMAAPSGFAAEPQAAQSGPTTSKPNPELVVPVHTTIPLETRSSITSRTAYVGQAVYCDTVYPITVGNRIVIPVGSYVKGTITQAVRPGHVKGRAQLGIRFDSITLPSGVTRTLGAVLSSYAGNGKEGFRRDEGKVEGESSKGQDAGTIAITGAEGAGIGSVAGISGGHSGAGAAIGGASGALGGLVYVLATRGKEIVLPSGTNFELELVAPLSFDRYDVGEDASLPAGPALPHRDPGPGL